ncbi:MAG: hypothetical protein ACT4PZ_05145 [Panacagrimonas sp.]
MKWMIAALLLGFAGEAVAAAMNVQISVGSIAHPQLPVPLRAVELGCVIESTRAELKCRDGKLRATAEGQHISADFIAGLTRRGDWSAEAKANARGLTLANASGSYASDKLDLNLQARVRSSGTVLDASLSGTLPRGQLYVEPVFVDFASGAASITANVRFDTVSRDLHITSLRLSQAGVLGATGQIRMPGLSKLEGHIEIEQLQLAPAFTTYAQPFLAGTSLEKFTLDGEARGTLEVRAGAPHALELHLDRASFDAQNFSTGLRELTGTIHWAAQGPGLVSDLRWSGGHIAKLDLGASDLQFRTTARDVELLAPLRLPMADGALKIRELAVQRAGLPDMGARFDAEIEPLDLATLCRAFGWPEFGGSLGGRLPGLQLQNGELKLDGALTARAFDGEITVDGLRVLDALGRVPRVQANIRLRNLDLAALTGAFSFGRIEGRLDGDVEDLRLLNWLPISFNARLGTPPNDRSRHRISQRAIDNISSIGGGPTGMLSRGAMSLFEDFGYERIGWSCVLANDVCRMDGIGPAKNGGYVLVKGRWLPRIDVVGFNKQVDWSTFVTQLQNARAGGAAEVR